MCSEDHLACKREGYLYAYYQLQDLYTKESIKPARDYDKRFFFLAGIAEALDAVTKLIYPKESA